MRSKKNTFVKQKTLNYWVLLTVVGLVIVVVVGSRLMKDKSKRALIANTDNQISITPTGLVISKPLLVSTSTPMPKVTDINATKTESDNTKEWKPYEVKAIHLRFKLPPIFDKYGEMNEVIISANTGSQLCMTLEKRATFLIVPPVYAGGGACMVSHFGLGTTSKDYQIGRDMGFTDLRGYFVEGGKYYSSLGSDIHKWEIPSSAVTEFTNKHGIKMLKVLGQSNDTGELKGWPKAGTPGKGMVGLLINTNSDQYPGIAVVMELKDDQTEELFDEISSTFNFSN